ncbi:sensor histidine kinase [Dissulfurimicrobium hydrothermale]|uniref:sensor histidine kinase n=1 Tax=Dissulfurimicrobium hydrothermale TaxID=1750598 RepID=UPI001EDAF6E3|nr:HAMP domain-containing sensor histidine kinase [Dissulfurimicrobium hydrothermale]UKL13325.1 HAMP domain-containing histidine kinase [Dissulfurimicrobium hydrothermale]
MTYLSLYPIVAVDMLGCLAMIAIATRCLALAYAIYRSDTDNALSNYLLLLIAAIFIFSISRSLGHIVKYILHLFGYISVWEKISPVSGSINTITFVIIASVTVFFDRVQAVMDKMLHDRISIEKTSKELLQLNREVEMIVSERTQAEMALRMAHEARNPVMIIGGLARKVLKKMPTEDLERPLMEMIMVQAQRLEEMILRFEEAISRTKKYFSPQELNAIVEETIEFVRPEAEQKDIVLFFDRCPVNLSFQGNKYLIKVAIAHIIRNAIEVCGPGNSIEITTDLAGKTVSVTIKDNGPGIPDEIKPHIFEPFYKTHHGETGLGLPYVKQIIDEHKGEIRITSAKGKGTTVEIRIPTHISEMTNKA